MLLSMYQQLSAQLAPLHIQSREMQIYVNVVTSVSLRIQHASVKTDKNNKYAVFFLLSLLSFIFPHLPLISCKRLTTCETYAMWLILKPPNLMYSFTHHCLHMFLSFIVLYYISYPCAWCVNIDQLDFFQFNFSSPCMHGHTQFTCGSILSSTIITPFITLPLTRLNSSPLLPFPLFCRAPVTPSGVTRTASDSRRTCYLVTRL